MSEAGFRLFYDIVIKAEVLLSAACMTAFFGLFMAGKVGRAERRKTLGMLFLAYTAVYLSNAAGYISVNGWACMLILSALLMLLSGFWALGRKETFLLVSLFYGTRYMGVLIAESVRYVIGNRLAEAAKDVESVYRNTAITCFGIMVFQYVLLAFMLYLVRRTMANLRTDLHIKELCFLCLIPVAAILSGSIIFRLFIFVKEDVYFRLYEQYPVFTGLVPLLAFLFYVGMLITIKFYREMMDLQEEKNKFFVEEQQLSSIRERMEEVERFYDGICRMKHEMRNHLTNIRGLAVKGSYEDMERYLSKMDESMEVFEFAIKTGNAVTDVIVNDKYKAAQKMGIEFQSEFAYPASDRYNAYDLGIIINNLLQNALEACGRMTEGSFPERKRYISFSGRQKKKFFLIQVSNSFEGEILFDKITKLPISVKRETSFLHGIGLSNVKHEAEKYMGDVDIAVKGNEFSVTVLLQENGSCE